MGKNIKDVNRKMNEKVDKSVYEEGMEEHKKKIDKHTKYVNYLIFTKILMYIL